MDLIAVKQYVKTNRQVSIRDVALHFKRDADTVRPLLDVWVGKGKCAASWPSPAARAAAPAIPKPWNCTNGGISVIRICGQTRPGGVKPAVGLGVRNRGSAAVAPFFMTNSNQEEREMKNRKVLNTLALGTMLGAALTVPGLTVTGMAEAAKASAASREIREMRAQIEELRRQNEALSQRLQQMEQGMSQQDARIQAQESKMEEQAAKKEKDGEDEDLLAKINERVSLHGAIEADVRFRWNRPDGGPNTDSSVIIIDNVTLELEAKLAEWAKAVAVLKYEGGENKEHLFMDEAYMTFGGTDEYPMFATAGKVTLPFGDYDTWMIQDPLTQAIGEITDGALVVGYTANGFTASLFAYNGLDRWKDEKKGSFPKINGFGAAVKYEYEEEDGLSLNVGTGIVSNLGSSGIGDAIGEFQEDTVAGLVLNAMVGYAGFGARVGWVTALQEFNDLAWRDGGAKPSALVGELSYTVDLGGHETTFALGMQKTWEAVELEDIPEYRYSVATSFGIIEGFAIKLEYFWDKWYDIDDGGEGGSQHGFTTRLSYEF